MSKNILPQNGRTVIKVDNGRVIGSIEGNRFIKRVKASLHQLRNPKAWCISKEPFIEQILPSTEYIVIEDEESGKEYTCSTELFAKNSFEICRGNFEPQLACPTSFFQTKGNGNEQLSLWGDGDSGY